jgi:hypothetical protein
MLEYEASGTLKKLGLPYKVIDACVNGVCYYEVLMLM